MFIRFNANIADDPGYVDIHPAIRIPKRMRHIGMPICCPAGSSTKGCRLATDPVSLISILQLVSDAEVRFFLTCGYKTNVACGI